MAPTFHVPASKTCPVGNETVPATVPFVVPLKYVPLTDVPLCVRFIVRVPPFRRIFHAPEKPQFGGNALPARPPHQSSLPFHVPVNVCPDRVH